MHPFWDTPHHSLPPRFESCLAAVSSSRAPDEPWCVAVINIHGGGGGDFQCYPEVMKFSLSVIQAFHSGDNRALRGRESQL